MKIAAKIAVGAVILLAAIQLVTCQRTNPPITGEIDAPANVKQALRRSCYDCHSNETRWPWYAHVAPMSWLLHRDVSEGRRHLNFSEWKALPAERRARRQKGIGKEIASGDMPLWFYLPLHHDARLSAADSGMLRAWADGPMSN